MENLYHIVPAIQRELEADEHVVWCGTPEPKTLASPVRPIGARIVLYLFILLMVFRLPSMNFGATITSAILAILASLFLLIVAWTVVTHLRGMHIANNTFYAITSQRVIIVCNNGSRNVNSFRNLALDQVTLIERADGSGNLIFGDQSRRLPDRAFNKECSGFYAIPDVRQVERYLKDFCTLRPRS